MNKKIEELKEACFLLSSNTNWAAKPVDVDIINNYSEQIFEYLIEHRIKSLQEDIDVVINATHYICQVHAIPPIGSDLRWFKEKFETLMSIVYPSEILEGKALGFVSDILRGLALTVELKADPSAGSR